jgi:2-haloacid dehalogenase
MLSQAVAHAGLDGLFEAVLSVDAIHIYKTAPEAYRLATQALGLLPEAISFQSSNAWDIAGATRFGFRTVWINRTGQPGEYPDLPPAHVLDSLAALVDLDRGTA